MQHPLQITILNVPNSGILDQKIRLNANKLEHYYNNITRCRVVVDMPEKKHHQGKLFNVRINISVPEDELVINRHNNENVFIAIREAFHAAQQMLLEHKEKIHGEVKVHKPMVLTSYKKEQL